MMMRMNTPSKPSKVAGSTSIAVCTFVPVLYTVVLVIRTFVLIKIYIRPVFVTEELDAKVKEGMTAKTLARIKAREEGVE